MVLGIGILIVDVLRLVVELGCVVFVTIVVRLVVVDVRVVGLVQVDVVKEVLVLSAMSKIIVVEVLADIEVVGTIVCELVVT